MKLAIFHTEFAYSGGAEKLLLKQVDYLAAHKVAVDVYIGYINAKTSFPEHIGNYPIKQILPRFLNKFLPHDLLVVLTTLLFPLTLLKYRSYDLYLGENQAGPWWAGMAALVYRKPYITSQPYPTTITYPRKIDSGANRNSFITTLILKYAKTPIIAFDKWIIKYADVSFAIGEYAKLVLEKAYGREFINCKSGADRGKFTKNIWQKRFHDPYILITNRHFPAKKFEYGIKALAYLPRNVSLKITGKETEYTNSLKHLARKLGVQDRVEYVGLVNEKELSELYKNALCYLYTSPEEDFGMGIVEAFAWGVPVVAWNNAGPKHIIHHNQDGFLAELKNPQTFYSYTKKLIADHELNFKMAQNAYKESANYTWEKHGELLLGEIQKLLKKK